MFRHLSSSCCCGGTWAAGLVGCSSRRFASASASASTAATATAKGQAQDKGKVIFSGIQPTGIPHLGNYLGALRNWLDLQTTAGPQDRLFFSIVGLHAITMPQSPRQLWAERRDMMATLLAIGLDPERSTIFHQEQVHQHAELGWVLNCLAPFGRLQRMTTWKAKLATAQTDESHLALGLFAYPVLQAADILLYRATHVPVGEDQVQHLELSRDLADLFNRTYKSRFFPLPQHLITPTKRVLSLRDPASKMSKSAPDANSRILLTDTPADVHRKVRRAVTDSDVPISYDPATRPGVSNLLSILHALHPGQGDMHALAQSIPSALALKNQVTEAVVETLRPIQDNLHRIAQDPAYLDQVERSGREKAEQVAQANMQRVRQLVGFEMA